MDNIERHHQHGPTAFEETVEPHLAMLHRWAYRLTHDRTAAEDLVQDTLERSYRAFHTYQPGTNARGWLLCIMRRLWISGHRRQIGAPSMVPFDEFDESSPARTVADPLQSANVEACVVDQLGTAAILAAILQLPPRLRQVVVLAAVEDAPYVSIAESLAIPLGTVASRLSRGRQRLQRQLREQTTGAGYLAKAG